MCPSHTCKEFISTVNIYLVALTCPFFNIRWSYRDAHANQSAAGWKSIDFRAGDGGCLWALPLCFTAPAQMDGPFRATGNLPGGGEMLRSSFKRAAATNRTRLVYLAPLHRTSAAMLFGSRHMRERPFQQTSSNALITARK